MTFGEKQSQQFAAKTLFTPQAAAVRRMVPTLPGSRSPSRNRQVSFAGLRSAAGFFSTAITPSGETSSESLENTSSETGKVNFSGNSPASFSVAKIVTISAPRESPSLTIFFPSTRNKPSPSRYFFSFNAAACRIFGLDSDRMVSRIKTPLIRGKAFLYKKERLSGNYVVS